MNCFDSQRPGIGKSRSGSASPIVVRIQGSERTLPACRSYLVGRDPECDIVVTDARVSWRHAVLRLEAAAGCWQTTAAPTAPMPETGGWTGSRSTGNAWSGSVIPLTGWS